MTNCYVFLTDAYTDTTKTTNEKPIAIQYNHWDIEQSPPNTVGSKSAVNHTPKNTPNQDSSLITKCLYLSQ